jgi:hypothetical protein
MLGFVGADEAKREAAHDGHAVAVSSMKLRGFTVAGRKHEGRAGSAVGANRTEQVGRLGALIVDRTLRVDVSRSKLSTGPHEIHF